jgi:cyclophilin family peptidyl-prolyl cis-trans isomerase/HEAT repeat protein
MRPLLAVPLLIALAAPVSAQRTDRPSDRLLQRRDLQALVALQVERNGSALSKALTSPDAAVRARAAFALASVQDSSAASALLRLLGDPVSAVRADAAFALGQATDSTSEGALLTALRAEQDRTVRARLMEALGRTGGRTSLTALAAMPVSNGERPAQALAIGRYGLRNVHHPDAIRVLVAALTSADARTRRNAAYYFGRVRPATPWASEAPRVRAALDAYAPGDEAAMMLVLGIGQLSDASDTPRLARWLRDATDWRTRTNAARALAGRLSEAEAASAMLRALDDSNLHVSIASAEGFGAARALAPATVQALAAWVQAHPRAWQAVGAMAPVLLRAGESAYFAAWAARQQNPFARAKGLAALAEDDGPASRDTLLAHARDANVQVGGAALRALGTRWARDKATLAVTDRNRYFAAFATGVRRGDVATVSASAAVLADSLFRPLGGVGVLVAAYRSLRAPHDAGAMGQLLRALGASRDPSAAALLRAETASSDPDIARVAASALRRLTGVTVDVPAGPSPAERRVDWAFLARVGPRPRLAIETVKGRIVIEFATEEAPLTTQTLLQLAAAGRFDGVPFHRVVANFVIQGGDVERGDGSGGPGFAIRSEFTRIAYERGTAGMASSGKDTEGSQWFVTHSMQPHLDGRYTAFGRVVAGLDVVDRIVEGDRALRVRVVR